MIISRDYTQLICMDIFKKLKKVKEVAKRVKLKKFKQVQIG
jgi:hypothetical protein